MSIRKAIYDLLNDTETDCYPVYAPQELTDPYVVFFVNRSAVRSKDGIEVEDVQLTLHIYANDFSDVVALADSMKAALEDASGSYDTETLMVCNWISEGDDLIPELEKKFIMQEYQLRFT